MAACAGVVRCKSITWQEAGEREHVSAVRAADHDHARGCHVEEDEACGRPDHTPRSEESVKLQVFVHLGPRKSEK
ncbi:hypothetical protein NDU88_000586 [Pleurodeles waltl]|uniref:Uncharacterized protein n=1 Tax=Pleurodeles waltl TaxID=8319 RepID=A0AAV7NGI4_PLEWA|nr:hypothetical protein NDU88_000586 [Pleurodeles waltl]